MKLRYLALLTIIVLNVKAHTEPVDEGGFEFGLTSFFVVLGIVILALGLFFGYLYKFTNYKDSIPIKKIAIVVAITLTINAVAFGFIYVEV